MKRITLISLIAACAFTGSIQQANAQVPLDSCRSMALRNNKALQIANEKIRQADYQKKEAFAAYLPGIDFAGGYTYNQKNLSIFDSDQLLPTKSFDAATGKYNFNLVTNPETGMPVKAPDGSYIPSTVALIPKDAMTFDIHNVFAGAVTLTQPIYMGGKIVAMNKITKYAQRIAEDMRDNQAEETIYAVDAAYWQVVSLKAKYDLATSYVALLDTLYRNVNAMKAAGLATKSDLLQVEVKLNSANIDLTKVENGLSLSRMALNQLCGLPVNEQFTLADENTDAQFSTMVATEYNINDVYARRHDVKALENAVKVYEQQQKVALSGMLPNIALVGAYSFSNPNMFNGFKKRFDGAFSVGAMITIPIWHWGGNINKYKAAKSNTVIQKLQLANALEMIELQVRQASYKTQEAVKTYNMTCVNISKADENLRQATLAFKEGMMSAETVMEAQTAWLKANSEKIDAGIDLQLCKVYLSKVLGTMNY